MESNSNELLRLVQDIEFIQLLTNPNYLHYLFNNGYFQDSQFIQYLRYLCYLKNPKFKRFITYSRCFIILDLLDNTVFRDELGNIHFINYLHNVIDNDWASGSAIN